MIELAWAVSTVISLVVGYLYRDIRDKMSSLKVSFGEKVEKRPEETKSSVIDPFDMIQVAQFEHKQMMERMNPGAKE